MEKKEIRKANGDVCFEAYRLPGNSYICVHWMGVQSLETMVMGGSHLLSMLRELPCRAILNSNQELVGPWDDGAFYLAYKWAPAAASLGLHYFAHVLSPGIFGRRSFEKFKQH
ncbi:hypothetical protein EFA69_17760 [Rufibacter immobilis]|uniref:Uncharacterized protein n=1 Tax=Rufibacter immobilis TaxID=1348778 RepID=A0A3M9MQW9_9BACT|nr:hypothetical protein [Rufibacter immobilis]RNI27934.1 hypothetical protein EFA69_17760 [Rufibacter immobilis]